VISRLIEGLGAVPDRTMCIGRDLFCYEMDCIFEIKDSGEFILF
jgi:hypothetical protein